MTTKDPEPLSAAEFARCRYTAPTGADTNDGITISRAIYDAAASIREGLDNLADAVREQNQRPRVALRSEGLEAAGGEEMSEPKHSPTPWRASVMYETVCVEDANGYRILYAPGFKAEHVARQFADAELAARAANAHAALVKALEECKQYIEDGISDGRDVGDDMKFDRALLSSVRAALALAKGE